MLKSLAVGTIRRKGGSLVIAIPGDVIDAKDLKAGDYVAFIKDKEGVYIENMQTLLDNFNKRNQENAKQLKLDKYF